MNNKVLLLGGTGAMGMYLCEILYDKGYDVIVTSRQERKDDRICYVKGNAHDYSFLEEILKTKYYAIVDFMLYSSAEFDFRIKKMLESCDLYVFLSSSRVFSPCSELIKEDSPLLINASLQNKYISNGCYSIYKANQERTLFEAGNNWIIVRPYITYSKERLPLGIFEKEDWLYRAMAGRTIVFSKSVADKYTTLTHGRDVAMAIAGLISLNESVGQNYNVSTSESVKWLDVLDMYLDVFEKHFGFRPKYILTDDEKLIPDTDQAYNDRYFNRKFDNTKISKAVSLRWENSLEGLKDCFEHFLKSPQFKTISWKREGRKDRLTKEWTPLKEIPGMKNKVKYLICRFSGY